MAENELRTLFMELVDVARQHHGAGNGIHTDLLERVDAFLADKAPDIPAENTQQSGKAPPKSKGSGSK
jgi:hypothetical protein